jgi:WD40 repeat protein
MMIAAKLHSPIKTRKVHHRVSPARYPLVRTSSLILLAATSIATAQLPLTRLSGVFPPGGKQGTTFEVTLAGSDLDEVDRLFFSHPGLTAKLKTVDPNAFQQGPQPVANTFVVTIAPDAPLGIHDVRAVGRFGASNPRAFVVSDRAEIPESGDNHAAAQGLPMPLDTVLNGRADAQAPDYFKLTLKADQRIIVDCWAQRIDSRMDATLVLFNAAGEELQRNRDHHRRDPLLDFTAPADGEYVLSVHDFLHAGGTEHFYRLIARTGPYIDFVFPPAGQAGSTGQYVIYGRNLPGGAPTDIRTVHGTTLQSLPVEITIPAASNAMPLVTSGSPTMVRDLAMAAIDHRFASPQGASNPAMLGIATGPVVSETEPNDAPEGAPMVTPPCELAGRFDPTGQDDWVAFNAKKGDAYWIEVFSERLGLLTDPSILIQRVTQNDKGEPVIADVNFTDDAGANIGGREFDTFTHDPIYRFQADQDAVYRIRVRDMYGSSKANPNFVYRLSIRPETPDFNLIAVAQSPPRIQADTRDISLWTPLVRRGGTTPIMIMIVRRDGFSGEVVLAVDGLPKGVTCPGATIHAKQNSTTLVLTATEDAPAWTGPIQVVGKANIGESETVREARGAAVTWHVGDFNVEPVQARLLRDVVLTVSGTETASVLMDMGEQQVWETSLAGKLDIPIKITRRNDFKGDLKLSVVGIPGMQQAPEVTIPAAAAEGRLQLDFVNKDKNTFEPGSSTFHLLTQAVVPYQNNPEAAKAAQDDLTRIEKLAADAAAQAKAAAEAHAATDADPNATTEAKAQAKTTADQAAAHAKAAEDAKAAAAANVKTLNEKANSKNITVAYYSTPVSLKLTPAPIVFAEFPSDARIVPGEKLEVPVKIERLYGFAEPVEILATIPPEHPGLKATNVTIDKDKSEVVLPIEATVEAKLGDLAIPIRAKLTLNGQAIEVAAALPLKIAPELQPIAIAKLDRADAVDFQKEILPIFEKNCLSCHSSSKAKGRLILETPQSILDGGKTGPAIVAKNSGESLLLKLSSHQQKPVMPPENNRVNAANLSPEELALIKLWIDQGATGQVFAFGGPLDWQPLPERVYPIYSVAITRDGRFAAAGRGDQIDTYHVASGRRIGRLVDPQLQRTTDGKTLTAAHRDIVQSVAFNATGDLLASGGFRTAKLWRRPANIREGNLAPPADAIQTVTVSPDGKYSAAGLVNGSIQIWDVATGQITRTLGGHTAAVTALQYAPDGAKLVSGSLDKTIRTWNATDGAQWTAVETPAPIHALILLDKGAQILTGGADHVIRVWPGPAAAEADAKAPPRDIPGHAKPVTALAAIPTSEGQFLSGSEDGTVRQWNADDGKQIRQMDHGGPVTAVAVRADGKRFASAAANHVVKLWDGEDGQLVAELKGDFRKRHAQFEHERALALSDQAVKAKEAETKSAGDQLTKIGETVQSTSAARVAADRVLVEKQTAAQAANAALASAKSTADQFAAAIKEANDAKAAADKALADAQALLDKAKAPQQDADKQFAAAEAAVKQAADQVAKADTAATSDPSNAELAKAKADAEKAGEDAAAAQKAATERKAAADKALADATANHKAANDAKVNADQAAAEADAKSKQAAATLDAAKKQADAADNATKVAQTALDSAATDADTAMTDANKNATALVSAKAGLGIAIQFKTHRQTDLEAVKKTYAESEKPFRCLAFSDDAWQLAAAGDDGILHLWDSTTGQPIDNLQGHAGPIHAVAYTLDGTLFSGSADKQLIRWNPNPNWTLERTIGTVDNGEQLVHRVNAVAFSPDGTLLATASGDPARSGQLRLWNVADGKLVRDIPDVHADTILALAFSPDGTRIATASTDRFAKVFNVVDGKLVNSFEGHTHHVLGVSWKADGNLLASAGADQVVKIWNVNTGDRVKNIGGFGKEVTGIRYVGLGDDLLTCSGDKTVRWNDRQFAPSTDFLYTCAASLDADTVITGGLDGVLQVWNPKDGKVLRTLAPPPLEEK